MVVKHDLEAELDRIMGFAPDHGAAAVKRSGLKLRKEVKLMDTTNKDRAWLRTPVLDCITGAPHRDWRAVEVKGEIGHDNLDSINSTLSELAREDQYPVTRVAPGRYRYVQEGQRTTDLVEKVERITRGETLRAGDLLEVVFVRGGKVLALDSDDNLLVISTRKVENF